jgi:hypothetical protein
MKKFKPLLNKLKDQKGVTAILVAVGILVFLFFVALAIDIGYAVATKNQLQNVADSAALAGARKVGQIYQSLPSEEQPTHDFSADAATINQAVKDAAFKNQAGVDEAGVAKNIVIRDEDIEIGHWDVTSDPTNPHIDPPDIANYKNTDAVGVIARRDSTQNSPLTTFFAKAFGVNTISLASRIRPDGRPATIAALSGAGSAPPPPDDSSDDDEGYVEFPVGISKRLFDTPGYCDNQQTIKFYPTAPSGCAAWQTFKLNANGANIKKILADIAKGTFTRPEIKVHDTVNFTNGDVASGIHDLYDYFYDPKGNNGNLLTTTVVVYDSTECNPSGATEVYGFATLEISAIADSPAKAIIATVKCGVVGPSDPTNPPPPSHGGGGDTGTYGSIPNLVK